MNKTHKIIYWVSTVLLALGMLAGGLAQLFRVQANVEGVSHLGYPVYLLTILGVWKILGVIALLIPNFKLLKEWAYAGFFFAMSGAFFSHLAVGDSFGEIFPSMLFLILTFISWYFRPLERKIYE